MAFVYPHQIRFHETDGAGVVYFANVLTLCHEAYEASLAAAAIDLGQFFDPHGSGPGIAVPIVHADVDFFRPMRCGDRILIQLTPQRLKPSEFEIRYQIWPEPPSTQPSPAPEQAETHAPRPLAQATTRHVCIAVGNASGGSRRDRSRTPLSPDLDRWLQLWQRSGCDRSFDPSSVNP